MPPRQRDVRLRDTYRMYLDDYIRELGAASSLAGSVKPKHTNSEIVPMIRRARRRKKVCDLFNQKV